MDKWDHCEAAFRANLHSVWVTNRSQKRRFFINDRQSGTVGRICSSMKVHQWSRSIRLETVRNSSLLRA